MEEVAADTQQFSTMNKSHFEGLTTTPEQLRSKGDEPPLLFLIIHYFLPEFYHENIARYCSTHNYCFAGCSSR